MRFIVGNVLRNRKKETLADSINKMVRIYNNNGVTVQSAFLDGEFASLRDFVNVTLHIAGAGEHVGDIERLIRVIKERFRAILSTLPFKRLPTCMIVALYIFVL